MFSWRKRRIEQDLRDLHLIIFWRITPNQRWVRRITEPWVPFPVKRNSFWFYVSLLITSGSTFHSCKNHRKSFDCIEIPYLISSTFVVQRYPRGIATTFWFYLPFLWLVSFLLLFAFPVTCFLSPLPQLCPFENFCTWLWCKYLNLQR